MSNNAEQYTVKTPAIVKFLLGECDFKGLWYGDTKSVAPKFWWRPILYQEVEELIKENQRAREENKLYREALTEWLPVINEYRKIMGIGSDVESLLSKFQPKKDESTK